MEKLDDSLLKRVYTGGTFDLLHPGHIDFLKKCSEFGSVTVSLNSDEFIERYKGKKPIFSFEERKYIISSLKFVSEVIINEGDEDSKKSILKVKPNFIVVGSDWVEKDYCKQMTFDEKFLIKNNITLIFIPRLMNFSSSNIKKLINES